MKGTANCKKGEPSATGAASAPPPAFSSQPGVAPVPAPVAAAGDRLAPLLAATDELLGAHLRQIPAADVVPLVASAPALEDKTRVLRLLSPGQRIVVLRQLSPPLIAALIQNDPDANRPLLAEISAAGFHRLLQLCSGDRKFDWFCAALSIPDARAQALPLLSNNDDLADALLSRIEFVDHSRAVFASDPGSWGLPREALRSPIQALVDLHGVDLLREFPVAEPRLEGLLRHLLELDPDRYVDLLLLSLRRLDYAAEHEEEERSMREEPLLLHWVPRPEADLPPSTPGTSEPGVDAAEAIVPTGAVGSLPGMLAGLSDDRRQRLEAELQSLLVREAIAAGGSFAVEDLRPVARRIEGGLLLGLETLGRGRRDPRRLERHSIARVLETAARRLERLRQKALRLRAFGDVLDARQRSIVDSLLRPQLLLDAEGNPGLAVMAPESWEPDIQPVSALEREVEATAAWVGLARTLGMARTAAALARCADVPAVLAGLALSAVLYQRLEFDLAERADLGRFARRYLTPRGATRRSARRAVDAVAREWAARRHLPPDLTAACLASGLERLTATARGSGAGGPAAGDQVCLVDS